MFYFDTYFYIVLFCFIAYCIVFRCIILYVYAIWSDDHKIKIKAYLLAGLFQARAVYQVYWWLCFLLNFRRYYKVNEVQKFTFSRRKDTNTSDVTVTIFCCRIFTYVTRSQWSAGRSGLVVSASKCGVKGPAFEFHRGRLCLSRQPLRYTALGTGCAPLLQCLGRLSLLPSVGR